jgi:hypothetical protein
MNIIWIFLKSKLEIHNISKFDRTGKQKAWRASFRPRLTKWDGDGNLEGAPNCVAVGGLLLE